MIWQEIDIDAISHIFLNGSGPDPSSGQKLFSHGWMYAIPAITASDSWKPTDPIEEGDTASCTVRAHKSVCLRLLCRCVSLAVSFMNMNRKAYQFL